MAELCPRPPMSDGAPPRLRRSVTFQIQNEMETTAGYVYEPIGELDGDCCRTGTSKSKSISTTADQRQVSFPSGGKAAGSRRDVRSVWSGGLRSRISQCAAC